MNIEHYTYLLANPQKITSGDLTDLDILVQKHPYFQSARALQLKGLKNQESFRYNDALKLAAVHTTDRDILFDYITSEKFIQNEISQSILQQDPSILEIGVVSEDVTKQVLTEKDNHWKAEREKADAILNPDLFQRKVNSLTNLVTRTETSPIEKQETPKEALAPNRPLVFTKDDTHSFSEWLKLTKAKPIERSEKTSEMTSSSLKMNAISSEDSAQEEKERKFELIDKFIQERPKITPSNSIGSSSTPSQDKANQEIIRNLDISFNQATDSLMTETLARVYLQQKNYKKAIQAYKILILKNPEKSGFFADQIRAIEKLINTEEQ